MAVDRLDSFSGNTSDSLTTSAGSWACKMYKSWNLINVGCVVAEQGVGDPTEEKRFKYREAQS